jgi:hypothetical protein
MGIFLTQNDVLYTGDQPANESDVEMDSPKPSDYHVADRESGTWVVDTNLKSQVLEREYNAAYQRIEEQFYNSLKQDANVDRYHQFEIDGWHELVKDAEAGSGASLTEFASELGVSESDAATRILNNRDSFKPPYGKCVGWFTAKRDQADELYNNGDVEGLQDLEPEV